VVAKEAIIVVFISPEASWNVTDSVLDANVWQSSVTW
jgi:hypothetical protein